MEIIDEGFQDKEFTKVCKCGYCGCKFEAGEKFFYGIIKSGILASDYYFKTYCPKCKIDIDIPTKYIPQVAYNRIFKEKAIIKCKGCPIEHSISEVYKKGDKMFIKCGENNHSMYSFYIADDSANKVVLTDTMKILKDGYNDQKYIKECNCTWCGVKFRASEDLFIITIAFNGKDQKYSATNFYKFVIKCPRCKTRVILSHGSFPTVSYVRLLKKDLTQIRFVGCSKNHLMKDINHKYEIECEDKKHQIHETELGPNITKVIKNNSQKEKFE